ncbi:MAG: DUF5343 domain-containing protein [Chloroflexi bacterium]|nr:DUF5343 domain-containing protein [Chloroflexota bacterium]
MVAEGEGLNLARTVPPYGPVKGMLEGIHLLRRVTPAQVDEAFLKANGVAPHNEYKVIGALRYLGLIDAQGRPTERSRLLKTRGAAFTLNLQRIVQDAYADLFARVDVKKASRDEIHNYFITQGGHGAEMASKAARFFVELCRLAEIELAPIGRGRAGGATAAGPGGGRARPSSAPEEPARTPATEWVGFPTAIPLMAGLVMPPFVLAITPETARLSEEELVELFRRVNRAARRALLSDT